MSRNSQNALGSGQVSAINVNDAVEKVEKRNLFTGLIYLSKLSRFAVKWPHYISELSPNGLARDFWGHLIV